MNFGKRARQIWHDIYYKVVGDDGVDFAMTCREVVEMTNVADKPRKKITTLRYYLHLSVCQACKNYSVFSNFIKKMLKNKFLIEPDAKHLNELNNQLLNSFKKSRD